MIQSWLGRPLKLDLHTHCKEATGFQKPDERIAALIAGQIRARGIDGIAVTEHDDSDYGHLLQEIMARCHPEIVIIPGKERHWFLEHVVELHLGENRVFRFIAHPGNLWGARTLTAEDGIHGIEIANGQQYVHEDKVREFASTFNLLLLANSDAHTVAEIGKHHSTVDLAELLSRAIAS